MSKFIINKDERIEESFKNIVQQSKPEFRAIDTLPLEEVKKGFHLDNLRNYKDFADGKINVAIVSHCDRDRRTKENWGDYWVKEKLIEYLNKYENLNVDVNPFRANVVLYLFGSPYFDSRIFNVDDAIKICWFYSHPEKMRQEEINHYDSVFIASSEFIHNYSSKNIIKKPLYACTDFQRPKFYYKEKIDILFIGNARGGSSNGRRSVKWVCNLQKDWNFHLYGAKWERPEYSFSHKHLKGKYLDYNSLPNYYVSAKVNLIDGHDKMRNEGFVPAKVFDTIASGGWVVMEHNDGIKEIFGNRILMFRTKKEMVKMIDWSLDRTNAPEIEKKKNELLSIVKNYNYKSVCKELYGKIIELFHRHKNG